MAFKANIKPGAFRMHMGGKSIKFANFDKKTQDGVLKRLAEKDEVMEKGLAGIFPGIKIDGKQVTRDNLKDFKVKEKPKEVMKPKKVTKPKIEKTVTVKEHKKDVKPGPGKIIKKIESYKRSKPKKR